MKPDARTALLVSLLGVAAALASSPGALVALGAVGLEALVAGVAWRALALRLIPLASGFALLLVLLPLAPGPVLDVSLKGLAVAVAGVVLGAVVSWIDVVAALQGLGTPPAAVAFLVILGRHAEGVAAEARQAHLALATRGGFDRPSNLGRSSAILVARVLDRALHRADRVASALELRGFRGRVASLPRWRPRVSEAPFYAIAVVVATVAAVEVGRWRH
jgi:energy-coupling factor transporter transmembrane protein EcfT